MVGPSRLCAVLTKIPRLVLDRRFGREYLPFPYACLRVPLHQVPEALQRRAIDQRAQAAPRLPEMQVAGGRADVLDVLRQDRSQELTGRGPSASAALLAIRLWDPRVPTHLSLSSLSSSCWTSSANRSPRGRRPRADTAHSERSASWTRPHVRSARQKSICWGFPNLPTGRRQVNVGILSIP